jgi:F-type H+-transporting ATPase subunit alpha
MSATRIPKDKSKKKDNKEPISVKDNKEPISFTNALVAFDIFKDEKAPVVVPKKRPVRKFKNVMAAMRALTDTPPTPKVVKSKSITTKGQVISVKDGVAYVSGLRKVKVGEMVSLGKHALLGMALNLENEVVGCIIFGDDTLVGQGDTVSSLGSLVRTSVGEHLLGRVVNGLGKFIDSHPDTIIENPTTLPIERKAPGVITRESVTEPMLTGYKIIDSMLPIGRGQRELIIGDRQTGKTTLAIDAILNQRYVNEDEINLYCVYVAIGQKQSSVLQINQLLQENHASHFTTIVVASASHSAALQFIAPYLGCSIAEFFRDRGEDALIIYDDLTKHAAAYRQLSLLLRRPPGREAFPGDVFYAHSRLLERACKLNINFGHGSLTALPIVETQAGDLSGYIPTNIISITDGQIFLEKDLFFKAIRPAVNVGSSVSRVGSKAQPHSLKLVTGSLKYQLAQYREYSIFAQFEGDLDDITKGILQKGALLTESLKQSPNKPMSLFNMTIIILAASTGFILKFLLKDFKRQLVDVCALYESKLFKFLSERKEREELFLPLYYHIMHADKDTFGYDDNPLWFILKEFEPKFYDILNTSKNEVQTTSAA